MADLPLPDIANKQDATYASSLKWVGMEQIALPIQVALSDQPSLQTTAKANVYVSLDKPEAKGIHMSRLYIRLRDTLAGEPINAAMLTSLLQQLVGSQQGLSLGARVELAFELTLRKSALLSGEFGYQSYPVTLNCEYQQGEITSTLSLTIPYSSTCPCSAALARQALSDKVAQHFSADHLDKQELLQWLASPQGSIATPHSQRSYAYIQLKLQPGKLPDLAELIYEFEEVIGTPVQTAVKREDEQAFAKLNAENLMFCEDAARRLKQMLEGREAFIDYWFKVEHQESLHAHNAVVVEQKF